MLLLPPQMKTQILPTQSHYPGQGRKSGVQFKRRYPIGAELVGPNETHFRVWAPKAQDVDVVLEESAVKEAKRSFHPLTREDGGYFAGSANAT